MSANPLFVVDADKVASRNEYYTRNHQGHAYCKLCTLDCHTSEKFLSHIDGNKHQKMLKNVAQQKAMKAKMEADEREAFRAKEAANSGRLGLAGNADQLEEPSYPTPYGPPTFKYNVESNPATHECKVWFEVTFDKLADGSRPLHKWLSTFEQQMEPEDASMVFLVIAAEGYESISFKFPSKLARREGETKWNGASKVYKMHFVVG